MSWLNYIVTTFVLVVKEESTQKYMYAFLHGDGFCFRFLYGLLSILMDYCLYDSPEGTIYLSRDMRFQTMWYVRPAKPQISLRIRAV